MLYSSMKTDCENIDNLFLGKLKERHVRRKMRQMLRDVT